MSNRRTNYSPYFFVLFVFLQTLLAGHVALAQKEGEGGRGTAGYRGRGVEGEGEPGGILRSGRGVKKSVETVPVDFSDCTDCTENTETMESTRSTSGRKSSQKGWGRREGVREMGRKMKGFDRRKVTKGRGTRGRFEGKAVEDERHVSVEERLKEILASRMGE